MISHSNPPSISLDDIYNMTDDEELLKMYLGIEKIPCLINSPIRTDNNPSFSVYYNRNWKLRYYDFGTKEGGSVLDLLMRYFNMSFNELLQKIYQDLPKNLTTSIRKVSHKKRLILNNMQLDVKIRDFKDYDIEFWESFGISKEWLEFGRIYAISNIFITRNNNTICYPADKYAYCYVEFKDNKQSLKIYQPYSQKYKWINNHDSSVWDLWEQMPAFGNNLIITSSRKDALCLWANLGISSICLQAETNIPKEHIIDELKSRFKRIFILYDNDFSKLMNTGQENAAKLCERFGFINLVIDSSYDVKDPSDFFRRYGKNKFVLYFKKLINEAVQHQ